MLSCINCSLKFTTQQELNVHIAKCRKNMPTRPPLKSHICQYCNTSFMTAAELVAHDDTCIVKFRNMAPVECPSCSWKFGTVKEVIEHKQTCKVLITRNILEKLSTFVSATWADKQLPMISLPSTSRATPSDVMINPIDLVRALDSVSPSTSQDWSKEQFSRKWDLDTNTKVNCATQTDISQIPPLPIRSTSSKDRFVQKPRKRHSDPTKKEKATKSELSSPIPPQIPPLPSSSTVFRFNDRDITPIEKPRIPPLPIPSTSLKDCYVQTLRKRHSDSTKKKQATKSEFSSPVSPQVSPLPSSSTVFRFNDRAIMPIEKPQIRTVYSKICDSAKIEYAEIPPLSIQSTSSRDWSVETLRKIHSDSDIKNEQVEFSPEGTPLVSPLSLPSTVFRFNDRDITPIDKPRMPSFYTPLTPSKYSEQKSPREVVETDTTRYDVTKSEVSPKGLSQVSSLSFPSIVFRFNDRDITPIDKPRMPSFYTRSTPSKYSEQKSPRDVVETDTTKYDATKSEVSPNVSPKVSLLSSSWKFFRPSNIDTKPIEKPRLRVSDSKVCDGRKIDCAIKIPLLRKLSTSSKDVSVQKSPRKRLIDFFSPKKEHATKSGSSPQTSQCIFCQLSLPTLDGFKAHLLECPKRYSVLR